MCFSYENDSDTVPMTIHLLLNLSRGRIMSSMLDQNSALYGMWALFIDILKTGPNGELSDKILTQKLALFLLLLGCHRVQTLLTFHIDNMIINNISVYFVSTQPLKYSRNRCKLDSFEYRAYGKPDLCVVTCLREYLNRKSNRRDHKQLIITYGKPYKPASPDPIHGWVKGLFTDAKIWYFTLRSCLAASTSKEMDMNINIEDILRKGCWKNANKFYRFCHRNILYRADDVDFQKIIDV